MFPAKVHGFKLISALVVGLSLSYLGCGGPAQKDPVTDGIKLLKSNDKAEVIRGCQLLAGQGEKGHGGISKIADLLKSEDPEIVVAACMALSDFGPAAAVAAPGLKEVANNSSAENAKAAALTAVGKVSSTEEMIELAMKLLSGDKGSKLAGLNALASARVPYPIDPVIALIDDENVAVRASVILVLQAVSQGADIPNQSKVLAALKKLAKDSDSNVASSARQAIASLENSVRIQ